MDNLARIPSALQNTANTTVAANIRAELGLAGLDQTDLASALGRNDMWLSRRLNGATLFSVVEIQAIADYFGLEPGAFFIERTRPTRPGGVFLHGVGTSIHRRAVGPAGIEPTTSTV